MSRLNADFRNFKILLLGRLLGGIATSLLFSVFDAWLIRSHADANVKQFIGKSFSWAMFGNSIIAITAGLVANNAAHRFEMIEVKEDFIYAGGYLNPFDIALAALVCCGFFAATLWEENFGESEPDASDEANQKSTGKWHDGLKNAFNTTMRSPDIYLCGAISSLFEGSMYIFVFM